MTEPGNDPFSTPYPQHAKDGEVPMEAKQLKGISLMNAQTSHLHEYRRVNTYNAVEASEPHTLVGMLYDGFAEAITNAKGALKRDDMAGKGKAVVRGIDILESLRISLDMERGGDVAQNLERLYSYMTQRLTEANLTNEEDTLDELSALNETLRTAWASIPQDLRRKPV